MTLSPYSPGLTPIEELWDLIQDHTANKLWPTIKRLDKVVGLHLKDWWEEHERVISLFGKGRIGVLQQTLPELNTMTNLFQCGITCEYYALLFKLTYNLP